MSLRARIERMERTTGSNGCLCAHFLVYEDESDDVPPCPVHGPRAVIIGPRLCTVDEWITKARAGDFSGEAFHCEPEKSR